MNGLDHQAVAGDAFIVHDLEIDQVGVRSHTLESGGKSRAGGGLAVARENARDMCAVSVLVALAAVENFAINHARLMRVRLLQIVVLSDAAVDERDTHTGSIEA